MIFNLFIFLVLDNTLFLRSFYKFHFIVDLIFRLMFLFIYENDVLKIF